MTTSKTSTVGESGLPAFQCEFKRDTSTNTIPVHTVSGANDTLDGRYVQFGCGLSAPESWRNFDASPTLRLQRILLVGRWCRNGDLPPFPPNVEYGDIVRGLPVEPQSCLAIYSSHVLEHLCLADLRQSLKNIHSYLAEGGLFRFVLPDLEGLARQYVTSDTPDASIRFMSRAHLGKQTRTQGVKGFIKEWMGNSSHLWMWDYKSLSLELEQTGFCRIRRAEFNDSAEPKFKEIEDIGRWFEHSMPCLGMECMK